MLSMCSNRFSKFVLPSALLVAALAGGCSSAPKDLASGASWVAERHKVSDASVQRVEGMPSIRFDAATKAELDHAATLDDASKARNRVLGALAAAHAIAERSTRFELDRLDDDGWKELNHRYFNEAVVPGEQRRDEVRAQIAAESERGYAALVNRVRSADNLADLRATVAEIDSSMEESIKTRGRTARALPWLVFSGASRAAADDLYEKTPRGSIDRDFKAARLAQPEAYANPGETELATSEHWSLLTTYAPVIVQETNPSAKYDQSIDEFGAVTASSPDDIAVDTDTPSIYAYAREIPIGDERHVQLVYTFWYPQQAQADGKRGEDTGNFDGPTVRVTLDENYEPIFFETLDACGCYHRIYPTQALEDAASAQYGAAVGSELSPIEQCVKGKKSLVMGHVLRNPDAGARPVVRTTAGDHSIIDLAFTLGKHQNEVKESVGYTLLPYSNLEHIALPDGSFTSMFYENGLVKGAQRDYGKYFTPMGILSAGQPRQRGTQLIQFDDWDFDDPAMFEQALRWPRHALVHPDRRAAVGEENN